MKYNRVLLKLSGQMLGRQGEGFSPELAADTVEELKSIVKSGLELAILVGGGNLVRARDMQQIERLSADFMGMTGTVINALGLKAVLTAGEIESEIYSALKLEGPVYPLSAERASKSLTAKKVVIFAGGTGAPYVSTDTAAVLRALEIKADILLKATKVNGVYSADPEKDPNAERFSELTYDMAIKQNLQFMDMSALSIASENSLKTIVFNFQEKGSLKKVIEGENIGTLIK